MKISRALILSIVSLVIISCSGDSDEVTLSNEKTLSEFKFLKSLNTQLDQDYVGTISGNTITIDFPVVFVSENLIASFVSSSKSKVTVGGVQQVSGQTANNFEGDITYTVTAEDLTTSTYKVELNSIGNNPDMNINASTSYQFELNTTTWINYNSDMPSSLKYYNGGYLARASYDFDKDGDDDILMGNLSYDDETGQLLNTARPINYLENNGGIYSDATSAAFGANIPGQVHPRKAALGDFDKNGFVDVVFAGHGFDAPPFPGEQALLIMNNNGSFTSSSLSPGGFFHSVSTGDIDNDTDIDIFFTDNKNQSKFFINDGSGSFTYDNTVFPSDISNLNYFTSEIYDLNKDGYLDLVIAGHTHESAVPTVLWGNYSGKYSKTRSTTLPAVSGWGVIIDINLIDINNDGLQDIVLDRQGDGTGTQTLFHGLNVQVLVQQSNNTFQDQTATLMPDNKILSYPGLDWFWIDWLRVYDYDADGERTSLLKTSISIFFGKTTMEFL